MNREKKEKLKNKKLDRAARRYDKYLKDAYEEMRKTNDEKQKR